MIECMEPIQTIDVIRDMGFIHQIKWDGIRGVAVIEEGRLRLYNKSGIESTGKYPELGMLPQCIHAGHAVLDGEIVSLVNGKPSFYHVLRRSLSKGSIAASLYPVQYVVFDLIFLNHRCVDVRHAAKRRRISRACPKTARRHPAFPVTVHSTE